MNKLLFSTLALVSATRCAFASGARVCFEAEKPAHIESPLRVVRDRTGQTSGGGFLEIPWDGNKTRGVGKATYSVNAPQAGVYFLWARCYWANGCGNTILVSANGGNQNLLGKDGTYDAWHWVGGRARVQLKKGKNTVTLFNRETGVRVDQFFLTTDADYVPTGPRKPTQ